MFSFFSQRGITMPMVVVDGLSRSHAEQWHDCCISSRMSFDYAVEESLWRRTQDARNRIESGWKSDDDARRRMIHYHYRFSVSEVSGRGYCFLLESFYFWWHVCLPKDEVDTHEMMIIDNLRIGGWKKKSSFGNEKYFVNGDLVMQMTRSLPLKNIYNKSSSREFPVNYESFEVTINDLRNSIFDFDHNITKELNEELGVDVNDKEQVVKFAPAYFKEGGPTDKMSVTYRTLLGETSDRFMERYNDFVSNMKRKGEEPEFDEIIFLDKNNGEVVEFLCKKDVVIDECSFAVLQKVFSETC